MIETHTIRLRGPWECDVDGIAKRVHMPAAHLSILAGATNGRLLCRRRFGCPTCLEPHERVWLVIERAALSGVAELSGARLGEIDASTATAEFDITGRLRERNELSLRFDAGKPSKRDRQAMIAPSPDELLFADVRLEIRG